MQISPSPSSFEPATSAGLASLTYHAAPTIVKRSKFRLIKVWSRNLLNSFSHDPYFYYIQKRRTFWKWSWWTIVKRYSWQKDAEHAFNSILASQCDPEPTQVLREE